MKKQILADGIIYFICMIVAVLLNLAVSALTVRVGTSLMMTYFGRSVIRLVTGFLVSCGVIGGVVYRECYKSVSFRPRMLIPALGLAGAAHLILCLPLKFYPFIAGGVRDLAGLLSMGTGFSAPEAVSEIRFWAYLVAFAIFLWFQIGTALVCGYVGKKRRLKSREGLNLCEETKE